VPAHCIFCGIVDGTAPSYPVAEDAATVAFLDINPANAGHVLVIPRAHSRDLLEIPADDLAACSLMAQRIARVLTAPTADGGLGADGVNLLNCCGAPAWQTVFHFHLHVIPRYRDTGRDQLRLPWRPDVPGDPAELSALAARLSAATG